MNGVIAVYYREISNLIKRWPKVWSASIIYPTLFLLTFGYGIGKNAKLYGVSYVEFLIPGLITMSSMSQAYGISLEIHIARYYYKIFDEYITAPISRWEIVIGEIFYGITKGLIPAIFLIVYCLVSGINVKIGLSFFVFFILHLCCFSLLGFIIAMHVQSHADQAAISTFVITPMIFLSDTFYPVEKMPYFIKPIAYISPLTYSTKLIRGTLLGMDNLLSLKNKIILIIITIILFIIALHTVKRAQG